MEHRVPCKRSTIIGCGALIIWAIEAVMVSELTRIPIFEIAAMLFAASFFVTAIRLCYFKRWHIVLKHFNWRVWLFGVLCICGSDLAYMWAFKYAPAIHVDLIDYCWPFFVVLCSPYLLKQKFYWRNVIGATLGLAGIFCLVTNGNGLNGFRYEYFTGYGIALVGMLAWGLYSLYSSQREELPSEMVGMYCLLGMIFCLIMHFCFENFIMPTYTEASLAIFLGFSGAGIAYQLWDHGIKFGNMQLMSILCYTTPPISMGLLILCGKDKATSSVYLACALITFGVIVASGDWSLVKNKIKKLFNR